MLRNVSFITINVILIMNANGTKKKLSRILKRFIITTQLFSSVAKKLKTVWNDLFMGMSNKK